MTNPLKTTEQILELLAKEELRNTMEGHFSLAIYLKSLTEWIERKEN